MVMKPYTPRRKHFSANQKHTYTEQFQNQCRQTQTIHRGIYLYEFLELKIIY